MGAGLAETAEIVEGATRLFVPAASLSERVPPREPAFFNPRARLNRDLSVIAYSAHAGSLGGPSTMLEALSGLGARGLRAANEAGIGRVVLNDLNADALSLAGMSAAANGLDNVESTRHEACRFLLSRSGRGHGAGGGRADIVDIDPFGSPAPYLDCCLRATARGGMLSMTATDLQVLNGLFPAACMRRYGGVPIRRASFGNESALRLMLGCLCSIAGRLDLSIEPLFAHSDQHYYRAYARVGGRAGQTGLIGHLYLCSSCGSRGAAPAGGAQEGGPGGRRGRHAGRGPPAACPACNASHPEAAGPLWTGPLLSAQFVQAMGGRAASLRAGRGYAPLFEKAAAEAAMPAAYHTLDETASRLGTRPPGLARLVDALRDSGFEASPTLLCPSGFRTNAPMDDMAAAFRAAAR